MHSQAIILLWAFLEGTIKTFVCEWIKNMPESYSVPEIRRIKVEIGQYESIRPEDRAAYIYELYERDSALGDGVSRFEKILSPLGISGPITDKIRKELHTLAQIRNVIMHRGGTIDRKLLDQCPYLKQNVGEEIAIRPSDSNSYVKSVEEYVILLICRIGLRFGVDTSADLDVILNTKLSTEENPPPLPLGGGSA